MDDHGLAADLATRAGELLVALREELVAAGAEPRSLKDEGDRRSNELLLAGLAERVAAGDAVLSEEARDDPVRLERSRVWIVDPLDGTREFGEPPRWDWAVHVALTVDGRPVAGAVALPALGVTYATGEPPPPPPPMTGAPRLIVSRTRPPAAATFLARALGGELVELGSAGAKAMAIVRGEADVYAHSGGQYEWDSCAPVAVAAAAGLHVSRLDGTSLRYNNADPYLPDLLVCRPELTDGVLDALRGFEG
ncbi:MAG: 3'(2'),5'-bisphosphate nucleotidase CysQ [Acidimicrobiales bacterium]|jgi:3'(2'), 5'-bisphosphate nucleotidase|nr:3'(2'),5'-bisphosphate nucleotidase CysQ [Acidimicrobiales bacterium]